MPPQSPITVPLENPIGGVVRAVAHEQQPPNTVVNANNVVPYDLYGRKRIAQRYGISLFASTSTTGDLVQGLYPVGFALTPGTPFTVPHSFISSLTGWTGPSFSANAGPFGSPIGQYPFVGGSYGFSIGLAKNWDSNAYTLYTSQAVFVLSTSTLPPTSQVILAIQAANVSTGGPNNNGSFFMGLTQGNPALYTGFATVFPWGFGGSATFNTNGSPPLLPAGNPITLSANVTILQTGQVTVSTSLGSFGITAAAWPVTPVLTCLGVNFYGSYTGTIGALSITG
jgi:hypothetical protein